MSSYNLRFNRLNGWGVRFSFNFWFENVSLRLWSSGWYRNILYWFWTNIWLKYILCRWFSLLLSSSYLWFDLIRLSLLSKNIILSWFLFLRFLISLGLERIYLCYRFYWSISSCKWKFGVILSLVICSILHIIIKIVCWICLLLCLWLGLWFKNIRRRISRINWFHCFYWFCKWIDSSCCWFEWIWNVRTSRFIYRGHLLKV